MKTRSLVDVVATIGLSLISFVPGAGCEYDGGMGATDSALSPAADQAGQNEAGAPSDNDRVYEYSRPMDAGGRPVEPGR